MTSGGVRGVSPNPKSALIISFCLPAQVDQDGHDSACMGGADPAGGEAERVGCNFVDRSFFERREIASDGLLPDVAFVSCSLLWRDLRSLERLVWPPWY